ncbi:MAG TPA: hypothetical protein VEP90_24175 [Methylomirabilota bacterium]|nr:hypothetical protein [Methylomirabilota bacterium]
MSISDVVAIMVAIVGIVPTIAKGVKSILDHNFEVKVIIITALIVSIICAGFVSAAVFISKATTIEINGHTSVPIPGLPAATETPTATPSLTPTPTSKVIPINQTMTCTNCTPGGYNFSLIVKEATIDPVKNQVTLLVAVQNNTSDSFSPYINYLRLQDMQTADTYDGTGDGFSNFDITAHQTILFRITYQFLPVAGHTYSLSCNLSREFDLSPITIKFY